MKRRLLSALLAMAMLLTMVPAAFAVDNEPGGENGGDTSKTVSVGKSITLTGTAAGEESVTHTWEITSGKNIITLNSRALRGYGDRCCRRRGQGDPQLRLCL